jgi:hypothetical protein
MFQILLRDAISAIEMAEIQMAILKCRENEITALRNREHETTRPQNYLRNL